MKPGDLVKRKGHFGKGDSVGLFVGMRTYDPGDYTRDVYVCAEVMWLDKNAPNGDRVSTIQTDLLEVVSESGR